VSAAAAAAHESGGEKHGVEVVFARYFQHNMLMVRLKWHRKACQKKVLDSRAQVSIVHLPSSNVSWRNAGTQEANTTKAAVPFHHVSFATGIVLTEKRRLVLVDIFPSEGRGSLRFTLCD
jgi:hypothetical protein